MCYDSTTNTEYYEKGDRPRFGDGGRGAFVGGWTAKGEYVPPPPYVPPEFIKSKVCYRAANGCSAYANAEAKEETDMGPLSCPEVTPQSCPEATPQSCSAY
jgi:hypothetical protein